LRTDLLDYHLPRELIAAEPAARREDSRLLVLDRASGAITHRAFSDIGGHLRPGDLLVVNDSRVIPARIHGRRLATGGAVEFLLLERVAPPPGEAAAGDRWVVLCRPAKKLKPGEQVYFANKRLEARVVHYRGEGEREVEFSVPDALPWLDGLGEMPLPPYIIQRRREMHLAGADPKTLLLPADHERYQTVYAREPGSVAAPTAGLHFSPELLARLAAAGVERAAVTLHVGPGTFRPVETDDTDRHAMHAERFTVPPETADAVNRARREGRRVVAVGTTSVRTLESACGGDDAVAPGSRETRLMIAPDHRFRAVDALLTNFHLPRSTLLMLVFAFAGRERVLAAYEEAIRERYRFYSYGDAMLIV
jgi:S-adenosylmethionine:tRNA ribosyltransferase-isomerase